MLNFYICVYSYINMLKNRLVTYLKLNTTCIFNHYFMKNKSNIHGGDNCISSCYVTLIQQTLYAIKIVQLCLQCFLYNKKTNEWFWVQSKEQVWCCVALWSVLYVIHSWPFKEQLSSFKCSFFLYESRYLWAKKESNGVL